MMVVSAGRNSPLSRDEGGVVVEGSVEKMLAVVSIVMVKLRRFSIPDRFSDIFHFDQFTPLQVSNRSGEAQDSEVGSR